MMVELHVGLYIEALIIGEGVKVENLLAVHAHHHP
jgi:hypothetical protein